MYLSMGDRLEHLDVILVTGYKTLYTYLIDKHLLTLP